jgi:hypothetical protein
MTMGYKVFTFVAGPAIIYGLFCLSEIAVQDGLRAAQPAST